MRRIWRKHNLPRIQYTFREVSCGIQFPGFANERSLTRAALFAQHVNRRLRKPDLLPETSVRQADDGSEYIGSWNSKEPSSYTLAVESLPGCKHHTIFPGAHKMQSDVEAVHNPIEAEFYELGTFPVRKYLVNKA